MNKQDFSIQNLLMTIIVLLLISKASDALELNGNYYPEFETLPLNETDFNFLFRFTAPKGTDTQYAPVAIVAVIDRSGSMTDEIGAVKTALEDFIEKELANEDFFGIVSFSDKAKINMPLTQVKNNKQSFYDAIAQLSAKGATCISCGLINGLDELKKISDDKITVKALLLFSDGYPTHGYTKIEKLKTTIEPYLNVEHPPVIHTFGYGYDHDVNYLTELANVTGGSYFSVDNKQAIKEKLKVAVQIVEKTVAINIEVIMEPESGCSISGELSGALNILHGTDSHKFEYSDISGGEKRDIIVYMKIPPVIAPTTQLVMSITLKYHNPETKEDMKFTIKIEITRDKALKNKEFEMAQLYFNVAYSILYAYEWELDGRTKEALEEIDVALEMIQSSSVTGMSEVKNLEKIIDCVRDLISKTGKLTPEDRMGISEIADSLLKQRDTGTSICN